MHLKEFQKVLSLGPGVLKLKSYAMQDAKALDIKISLILILLASFVQAFGFFIFPQSQIPGLLYKPDLYWVFLRTLFNVLVFLSSFLLVAKLAETFFKSKLDSMHLVKIMSLGSILGFFAIFPSFFVAVLIWWFFILHEALVKLGGLKLWNILLLVCIQIMFTILISYNPFPF